MTKTEEKKMETVNRHNFISRVYATVLNCIPEQTTMLRKQVQIRLTHQNYNRYIRFHNFGKDMNIQIFSDGNVWLELNEAMHSEHKEQLFEYAADEEAQNAFLEELRTLISNLIPVYMEQTVSGFHGYMDYVSGSKTAAESYRQMMAHYHCTGKESKHEQ